MSREYEPLYQAPDEVDTEEESYEMPQTGADASESHRHCDMSVPSQDRNVMETTFTNSNNSDRVEGNATQDQGYGILFAEMRRLKRKVVSYLVVLLVLVLVLVIGVPFVILMSYPASKKGEISIVTSKEATYTQQSFTHLTSTEATYTQRSSTHLTSTEATYTQQSSTHLTSTEATYTQRSFTYLSSTEDLGSTCYTACYRADGNILVGTIDGVKLVNRRNMAVTSYNTTFKGVTSIVELNNVIYLLHRVGSFGKVELCLPDMNNCQTLLEFNNMTPYVSTMTVSSRYIVVRNPDGDKLIIYDFISKQTKIKQPLSLYAPYFLPDGHLLAKREPTLSMYRLEDGELELLWTREGFTDLARMVADTDGLIYGTTHASKSVYVISPDGELLQTIHKDTLPASNGGDASISGDEIALPGWSDNKLHLFKINK